MNEDLLFGMFTSVCFTGTNSHLSWVPVIDYEQIGIQNCSMETVLK